MWIPARFKTANIESPAGEPQQEQVQGRREALVPGLLAITSDDRLYYLLLSASIDLNWKIAWARTLERAFELCRSQRMPLVIYDERLPGVDWRDALWELSDLPDHPAVLLAALEVNEEVWELVLQSRGYDAVRRSAGSQEWRRELLFALLRIARMREPC